MSFFSLGQIHLFENELLDPPALFGGNVDMNQFRPGKFPGGKPAEEKIFLGSSFLKGSKALQKLLRLSLSCCVFDRLVQQKERKHLAAIKPHDKIFERVTAENLADAEFFKYSLRLSHVDERYP